MKSDVVFPARNDLFSRQLTKNSLLVITPDICVDFSSLARSFAACSRVSPQAIIFASIGSY